MLLTASVKRVTLILIPLLLIVAVLFLAPPIVRGTEKALYPITYEDTVREQAAEHGIDPSLVMAKNRIYATCAGSPRSTPMHVRVADAAVSA